MQPSDIWNARCVRGWRQGGQSVANARHGHARQAASFAGDHSQVCWAECERSPGFTRMQMSQPASRAGPTHEDAQMESPTRFHTAPLRACDEPIVDVRSDGRVGHEGSERLDFCLPWKTEALSNQGCERSACGLFCRDPRIPLEPAPEGPRAAPSCDGCATPLALSGSGEHVGSRCVVYALCTA